MLSRLRQQAATTGQCSGLLRLGVLAGDIVLCSWARQFTLTVPLSTQVYKWVPTNLMLGIALRWTSTPPRGSRNTPCRFMLMKPEISAGLMGLLARKQRLLLYFIWISIPQERVIRHVHSNCILNRLVGSLMFLQYK